MADSDDSLDEWGEPRVRKVLAVPLPDSIAAPSGVTKFASLAEQLSPTEWSVPVGHLEGFMYANGPIEISSYNFEVVRSRHDKRLATRASSDGRRSYDDAFSLTEAGTAQLAFAPKSECILIELACTGSALHYKTGSNCVRVCCGGIGCCLGNCPGCDRFEGCLFRVKLTMTLLDVRAGKWCVATIGAHVRPGMMLVPPSTQGLKTVPSVMRAAAARCVGGKETPMTAGDQDATKLPIGQSNSRWVPPQRALQRVVKEERRAERGGSMDDASRCHLLVTKYLIQMGMVLCYQPGHILIMGTKHSLNIGRVRMTSALPHMMRTTHRRTTHRRMTTPLLRSQEEGRYTVVTDAKADTSQGRSKWSSLRSRRWPISVCAVCHSCAALLHEPAQKGPCR